MVLAKEAVEKGMVDRVETLDATLARVVKGSRGQGVRARLLNKSARTRNRLSSWKLESGV